MGDWPFPSMGDDDFFAPLLRDLEGTQAGFVPAGDIAEDPHELTITAELPGVKKADLKVEFKEGVLTLSGEREERTEKKDEKLHRIERRHGHFSRSFTLPDYVEPEKIMADMHDGCLKVIIPKAEKAKPKQIEVKVD